MAKRAKKHRTPKRPAVATAFRTERSAAVLCESVYGGAVQHEDGSSSVPAGSYVRLVAWVAPNNRANGVEAGLRFRAEQNGVTPETSGLASVERVALSRDEARTLAKILVHFANTGDLNESEG